MYTLSFICVYIIGMVRSLSHFNLSANQVACLDFGN